MAIVTSREGGARKRIPGITFYKVKGRKEWRMVWLSPDFYQGCATVFPSVAVDTARDPRSERFYYCSPVAQPVFLDTAEGRCAMNTLTASSWAQLPEGWKNAFEDYLRGCNLWPWS